MTTPIPAMQAAVEALEALFPAIDILSDVAESAGVSKHLPGLPRIVTDARAALSVLRAALDAGEPQPVAWALFGYIEGEGWVAQHPVRFTEAQCESDKSMYAKDALLAIRPLYDAPVAAPVEAREPMKHWCETCEGLGTIDETLGGESFSNPRATCPDCDGQGWWTPSRQDASPVAAAPQPVKWTGADGESHEITLDYAAQIAKWERRIAELEAALRELLAAEEAKFPPASAGSEAQNAWSERRHAARCAARALVGAAGSAALPPPPPTAMIEADDARRLAESLEKLRRDHWTHWTAQETHIAAVAVRHLRLLAEHNAAAVPHRESDSKRGEQC